MDETQAELQFIQAMAKEKERLITESIQLAVLENEDKIVDLATDLVARLQSAYITTHHDLQHRTTSNVLLSSPLAVSAVSGEVGRILHFFILERMNR